MKKEHPLSRRPVKSVPAARKGLPPEYPQDTSCPRTPSEITTLDFVSNMDKVTEYISRSRLTYAKKMLRIKNSKVLRMSKEELFTKITTLPRWQGKFEIDETDHTIKLKNYGQVENLIDLLDERYTRSDVTDEEYDTRAKKWVAAVV